MLPKIYFKIEPKNSKKYLPQQQTLEPNKKNNKKHQHHIKDLLKKIKLYTFQSTFQGRN